MYQFLNLIGATAVAHVLDSLGAVFNGCHDFVNRVDSRLRDAFVAGLCRIGESFAVCRCNVA